MLEDAEIISPILSLCEVRHLIPINEWDTLIRRWRDGSLDDQEPKLIEWILQFLDPDKYIQGVLVEREPYKEVNQTGRYHDPRTRTDDR